VSRATIERLYAAFARLDADAMAGCYASDAQFDDEAFSLRGRARIGGMWAMLCDAVKSKGREVWKIETRDITERSAHWEATYRFSATGRVVHNVIEAEFEFDDSGLISRQRDRFDFWRWARQALGTPGMLLGWSAWLRNKVRAQAAKNLDRFIAARKEA
jgi:SnoaL-like domain